MADQSLAILGCGTMGQAILVGLLRGGKFTAAQLTATTRRQPPATRLAQEHGVQTTLDNVAASRNADVVVVAVKPQRLEALLDNDAMRDALKGKTLISIAAGVRVAQLAQWLPNTTIIRAMPNTPCLIGAGMTVLAPGPGATQQDLQVASAVFESVGRVLISEDKHMDAVTSLNGSGPAFAYVVLEALADGGVMMGLPRKVAQEISAQVLHGAARMVLETDAHPAALKDQVTTPAGSTIAGLLTMEDGRIRSVLARAIQEATKVAAGLGRQD